jgi:hypothetical protein
MIEKQVHFLDNGAALFGILIQQVLFELFVTAIRGSANHIIAPIVTVA